MVGAKFIDIIPETVEQAKEVKNTKNYLFSGIPMSELIGKKHEANGFIYMLLQEVTGGETIGGEVALAVLRPVRVAVGPASYHLVSFEKMKYQPTNVVVFLTEGDYKVINRNDCRLI